MKGKALDVLLEKLNGGDRQAAEQAFLAYEPYLRMVVRRQLPPRLRAKFDSIDVVQSIWGNVMDGCRRAAWRFPDVNHLRAFLVKLTRDRFIDGVRKYHRAAEREHPLGDFAQSETHESSEPRPSEVAQANELWEQILSLCPPEHHELVRLKREGHSLDDIAAQTGLHKSSVRRILYELSGRLDARQQSEFCLSE